jgi:methionine biosynthesis protein MetW
VKLVEGRPSLRGLYEDYWRLRGASGSRPRYEIFCSWIEPGAAILDVGCGDGMLGELLRKHRGVDYVGCDIAEAALELCRDRGFEAIRLDVTEGFGSLESRRFDYVVLSEFLEHVASAERVLMQAAALAERAALVSIPNIAYWRHRLELLRGTFPRQWLADPREHLRFWSVRDFEQTVRGLGFRVTAREASNGRPWLRQLRPNLFGLQVCFRLELDRA